MNRIIFTGGRKYRNEHAVVDVLIQLPTSATIVTGGATGLDSLAHKYAEEMGFKTEVYPADWEQHGRSAGPIRNRQMAELEGVSMVIAFEGGAGTENMVRTAHKLEIPVLEVNNEDSQGNVESH